MSNPDDEVVDDSVPDEEVVPFTYALTSYGADYPVDSLVKRIREDSILIPDFQRKYVWSRPQASRFIESLLLGLPVPGVFFEKEIDQQKLLIIDGQQRLLSLYYFYHGIFANSKRQFALTGVQECFEGKTYETLSDEDTRRLDDSIIHATVVRQDEPSDDRSSIYHVFERLNTGGTPLSAQEIRTCVYHGPFCDLLRGLNDYAAWRELYGPENSRMKDTELILRFLALRFSRATYSRPMKSFLNGFMGHHRYLKKELKRDSIYESFTATVEVLFASVGKAAFRPESSINAAVLDSVMVGVSERISKGPIRDFALLKERHTKLLTQSDFVNAYKKATADEASVKTRIELAIEAFDDIP